MVNQAWENLGQVLRCYDWNVRVSELDVRIVHPFKDQIAFYAAHRQLHDLSNKVALSLQPFLWPKNWRQA